jgi:hypothetical protein
MYLEAIEHAFGSEIDFAQLVKLYGQEPVGSEKRYSPSECIGAEKHIVQGNPDVKAGLYELHRTSESYHENGHEKIYTPNQWLLKKG